MSPNELLYSNEDENRNDLYIIKSLRLVRI